MRQDEYEPKKWTSALQAWLVFFGFFFVVFASAELSWGSPPPVLRISLIPVLSRPAVEPPPPPELALAAKEEPSETPERLAEIVRENQKEEERKRKEKADADERKRKEKADEDERKRKEKADEEERKRKEKADEDERKRKEKADEDERKRKEKADEEERKRKEKADADERKRKEIADADAAQQRAAEEKRAALLAGRLDRIKGQIAGRIRTRIKNYLKTPKGVPEKNDYGEDVVVIVRVLLDENGYLADIPVVEQRSGYPEYDAEAVRALMRAAPLPMPKDKFIFKNPEFLKEFTEHSLHIRPN